MTDLRKAAEAVLERWDSPAWEWKKQGPTADLMSNLRTALAAEQPKQEQEPVASDDDEEFKREDVTTLLLEVMDWTYAKAHRNRPMTEAEQKVLNDIRTALAAEQPSDDAEALRRDAERLTDEQIDSATAKERDALLDHIYEYGTAAEGILERIRKLARAAIDAAMGDKT